MPEIVTMTMNPALDKSTSVERVVAERKLRCRRPRVEPGGGGINVARVIHRLGGQATALWSCGGGTGEVLKGLLDDEHVRQRSIPIHGRTRENFIVYEQASEQQYRFGMPGPEFDQDDLKHWINAVESLTPPPEFFIASGSLPPHVPTDFYADIVGRLPSTCRVIVDTKKEALRQAIERGIYLIKPNRRELEELTGQRAEDEGAIEQQAKRLVDSGKVQVVVVSMGAAGALLVMADSVAHLRAPAVPIRSKVGAGDSMVGGMVASLAQGASIAQAAAFGVAAGAAAVITPGSELCRRDDVERLYAEMDWSPPEESGM
jgi:6-phosphofructokinase 2